MLRFKLEKMILIWWNLVPFFIKYKKTILSVSGLRRHGEQRGPHLAAGHGQGSGDLVMALADMLHSIQVTSVPGRGASISVPCDRCLGCYTALIDRQHLIEIDGGWFIVPKLFSSAVLPLSSNRSSWNYLKLVWWDLYVDNTTSN